MNTDVTVVIPTIPGREKMLGQAVESVLQQTHQALQTLIQTDLEGIGAAATRNQAIKQVKTFWTAFLDDDDYFYDFHLERLLKTAEKTEADLVYPWFDLVVPIGDGTLDVQNWRDPLFGRWGDETVSPLGKPFGEQQRTFLLEEECFIPVTVLMRTDLLHSVGGFPVPATPEWPPRACEEWGLWRLLLAAGATFAHHPERTWVWRHHASNTSGRPWSKL